MQSTESVHDIQPELRQVLGSPHPAHIELEISRKLTACRFKMFGVLPFTQMSWMRLQSIDSLVHTDSWHIAFCRTFTTLSTLEGAQVGGGLIPDRLLTAFLSMEL
jgi:hypothetical protein